jgi:hypothetical protein
MMESIELALPSAVEMAFSATMTSGPFMPFVVPTQVVPVAAMFAVIRFETKHELRRRIHPLAAAQIYGETIVIVPDFETIPKPVIRRLPI